MSVAGQAGDLVAESPTGKAQPGRRACILAITPALLLVALFFVLPAIWGIYASGTNAALTGAGAADRQWVGLDNYRRLWNDPNFPRYLGNTLVFVLGAAVIGQSVGGLALALLFHRARRDGAVLAGVAFAAVLVAWLAPPQLAGYLWDGILRYRGGALNSALESVGLGRVNALADSPMLAVIVVETWRGIAFATIVFLGALQMIPESIYEAARLDGSGAIRRFWDHTLPALRQVLALVLLMTTIAAAGGFLVIEVLTGGGPNLQTETVALFGYHSAWMAFETGFGAAISVVLLLFSALAALAYLRIGKGRR